MKLTIREFLRAEGGSPFRDWVGSLEVTVRARVQARVLHFETGNLGDCRAVGGGVWEARLMFGPGYRIYFGRNGSSVILLLLGGDKASQRKDIRDAHRFWREYLRATQHGETQ
jgi:putative addiction module killer protein